MPTVVLTLFAGQGTGRTDQAATICPFGEHKKVVTNILVLRS